MSLQIVEKSSKGLSRQYAVTVSASDLAQRLDARLAEIAPQMNVKGFRPGKVPVAHVRRIHGKALMAEVMQDTLTETSKKVLEDQGVRPASQPSLDPKSDFEKVLSGGEDLSYEINVEVMPEFTPAELTDIDLKRPVYLAGDAEVDEALVELSKQLLTYAPRSGKAVKAKDGDQLVIDFIGRKDGVAFDGGTATDTPLVLGSNSFIPGFEKQLIGAKPGEARTVSVTFPAEYHAADLAGAAVEFEVTVKEVNAPADAKIDDELAKRVGMADLDALKAMLKTNLDQRYAQVGAFKLKRALLDVLDERHSFELPPRMVEAEFDGIWQQIEEDRAKGTLGEEDAKKSEKKLREEYRKIAERRVRLGLLLAEIGRAASVTVTDQELNQVMAREAQNYGAQAQEAFESMRRNPELQNQLRAPIFEAKVVDYILRQAKVEDVPATREEMDAEDDLPEEYGG
ncbi:MAG: trigger factor [Caulobacteraceae bacterium]|nr:trigger factor [Caulobacteraceae bacterium]